VGQTYDCSPCCRSQPPSDPGPSCGEIGGDYCSQSGVCPDGHDSLGRTYSYDVILDYYYCDAPGPVNRIWRRIPVGISDSCWIWGGRLGTDFWGDYVCKYDTLKRPCSARAFRRRTGAFRHIIGTATVRGFSVTASRTSSIRPAAT
jgi:hypothetical protein